MARELTQEQRDRKNQLARERRAKAKQAMTQVDFSQVEAKVMATNPTPDTPQDIAEGYGLHMSGRQALEQAFASQEADLAEAPQQALPPSNEIASSAIAEPEVHPAIQMTPEQVKIAAYKHYASHGAIQRGVTKALDSVAIKDRPPEPVVDTQAVPLYLVSRLDKVVYTNPAHHTSKGQMVKVGTLLETKGPDGKMVQSIIPYHREPANKKERIKAKAGKPFRDKHGVVA